MAETKTDSTLPGSSASSIKTDLMHFKDDILKDIRTIQISLDEKYIKADDFLKERINKFDIKISLMEKKISELSNLIVTDNSVREKVDSLKQFEEEIRDTIFKRRAMFGEFEKKTKDDIIRISNILTASVIYPGIIGNNTKFKTFHDYIDYTLQEIAQLITFKDKSGLDLTPFKRKIDIALDNLRLQMNNFCSKDFINTTLSQTEEKMQNLFKVYDDRLQDAKVENSQYTISLKKKTEEVIKQMEKIRKIQNQIMEFRENQEMFNNLNEDIFQMKLKINKMNEIIKELLSYHPATKKAFMNEYEKKSSKIYSGVKQYIKGNLNANELSSMRKFTLEKSNNKGYDYSYPTPNTTPFPSPDTMKFNKEFHKRNSYNIRDGSFMFLNNYTNNKDNEFISDKRKMFISEKSLKASSKNDDINEKSSEQELNKNNKSKKNMFNRRKTFNYINTTSLESSKLFKDNNNDMRSSLKIGIKNKIINEQEKDKDFLEDLDNIKKTKTINNINRVTGFNELISKDDVSDKNDISQKSIVLNNSKNKSSQFIIKEEDENAISDNSTKNLETINSMRRKNENKKDNENKKSNENKKGNENKKDNENDKEVKKLDIKDISNYTNEAIKSIVNKENKIENPKPEIIINDTKTLEPENKNKNINIMNYKEKINLYNSHNDDIKLVSIKKKSHYDDNDEKSKALKDKINSVQNNSSFNSNNMNSFKSLDDNNKKISTNEINSVDYKMDNEETKENNDKKILLNNYSFPKVSINPINNLPKNHTQNSINSVDNKNKLSNNYNYKQNSKFNIYNNIVSVKNINRTYSNLPKIKQDTSETKIVPLTHKNNFVEQKNSDIISKTLSVVKFQNQGVAKVAAYDSTKPKKLLLVSPNNIPPNSLIKMTNKMPNKNKSVGIQSEKVNKITKLENLHKNHQTHLLKQLSSNNEEYKALKK